MVEPRVHYKLLVDVASVKAIFSCQSLLLCTNVPNDIHLATLPS